MQSCNQAMERETTNSEILKIGINFRNFITSVISFLNWYN